MNELKFSKRRRAVPLRPN